jgi:tRNA-modifying protein YgfZ
MIIHAMIETATANSARLIEGVAPLPHLGVIKVEGEDAARFLHGQLTQDFSLLGLSEARLAAFCSAKGRMQASFIGFKRSHTEVLLVCSRDILAATLKRLSLFVLRAKAKLSDASADFRLLGLAGDTLDALAGGIRPPWSKLEVGSASLVLLYPADGQARALWAAPLDAPLPAGPALDAAMWQWGEVRSGIATITQPIVEAFVPQMLNYESVGGVNFKKGCYPGQEVVARSQFRGTLKRRTWLVHGDAPMAAGQGVFAASDADQPCGLVAEAAPAPAGGWDALVSVQISAAETGDLRLGAADGTPLSLQPLPYPLLDDI